ncbi:MAG: SPOR domain-containing protein [Myxococcales bacterium]|nr:SPOR domain-containing protein [Myxococcales bacterium]MCB9577243.1 SPOR domain-containing protein [Polyangiaceae bacterium]
MDSVNVRNLEQIQEEDPKRRSSRLGTLLLASLGGAALVVVGVMSSKRSGPPATSKDDPLAALVAASKNDDLPPEKLDGRDVTFPGILSDKDTPTTALAAVKDERGRLVKQDELSLPPGAPSTPPPATDRLPVVPLPAGTLLSSTPVTTEPKDSLTEMAAEASKVEPTDIAPAGSDGGYQLQVASFKDAADADAFVQDLRKRGHRAFRQAAYVPNRGLWHRVRIGPFKTKYQAILYKKKFESSERVTPFVVDPSRVELDEKIRAAKLAARKRKYGRE